MVKLSKINNINFYYILENLKYININFPPNIRLISKAVKNKNRKVSYIKLMIHILSKIKINTIIFIKFPLRLLIMMKIVFLLS